MRGSLGCRGFFQHLCSSLVGKYRGVKCLLQLLLLLTLLLILLRASCSLISMYLCLSSSSCECLRRGGRRVGGWVGSWGVWISVILIYDDW